MEQKNGDKDLMQRIARGDDRAFELLFKSCYARLVIYARKYLSDSDSAENVVQSVFVKLWEKRAEVSISNPFAYLMIAVRNTCINELKQAKQFQSLDQFPVNRPEDDEMPLDEAIVNKVQSVIGQLPEQRQRIFRLNRFEGLKYAEIASLLGISVKTVEAQMGKALKYLREHLTRKMLANGL